mgnify:CR=1 FL=1
MRPFLITSSKKPVDRRSRARALRGVRVLRPHTVGDLLALVAREIERGFLGGGEQLRAVLAKAFEPQLELRAIADAETSAGDDELVVCQDDTRDAIGNVTTAAECVDLHFFVATCGAELNAIEADFGQQAAPFLRCRGREAALEGQFEIDPRFGGRYRGGKQSYERCNHYARGGRAKHIESCWFAGER